MNNTSPQRFATIKQASPFRIAGLLSLAALVLTGCSAAYQDAAQTFRYSLENRNAQGANLSAEEIANFPYSGLYFQRGKQARAFIVLGFIDEQNDTNHYSWVTAEGNTVVTLHGRIVETSGFTSQRPYGDRGEHNLTRVSNSIQDPLQCIAQTHHHSTCPTRFVRTINYHYKGAAASSRVDSQFTNNGLTRIQLPAGEYSVYHIHEEGRFLTNNQRFTNEFWVQPDGHIVRSIQHIMPNDSAITLEQVKWIGRTHD